MATINELFQYNELREVRLYDENGEVVASYLTSYFSFWDNAAEF